MNIAKLMERFSSLPKERQVKLLQDVARQMKKEVEEAPELAYPKPDVKYIVTPGEDRLLGPCWQVWAQDKGNRVNIPVFSSVHEEKVRKWARERRAR